jgi:hypothetical protein
MEQSLQFTLPLSGLDASDEETVDAGGCIAIDANPYYVLAAFTASDGRLLDTLEAKPLQVPRVSNFIRKHKRRFPDLYLTGARIDRWPHGLLPALTMEFGPVHWVSDYLLRETVKEFRRTVRVTRFLRATYLAACAHYGSRVPPPKPDQIMDYWKANAFDEVSSWLSGMDDIPF